MARSMALSGDWRTSASSMVRPRQRGSVARMMVPSEFSTATASVIPAQARSNLARSTSTMITPTTLFWLSTRRE